MTSRTTSPSSTLPASLHAAFVRRYLRAFNGFCGVLDEVSERLCQEARVEAGDELTALQVVLEARFRVADLAQEQRLLGGVRQVADDHGRFGHACEGRELVDHAADVADLAHDRVRALVEDLAIVFVDLAPEAALQAFGGKLDGRQPGS